MKGKLLGLLSVVAGAAIVGTTFAAWAVTDNADPFSIKVTPGGSIIDETVAVTLKYGDTFSATNITGLSAEAPRMAAEVGLVAETSGAAYEGKFSLELEDLTTGKQTGEAKLIENLGVKVYSKKDGVIAYDAGTKVVSTDLTGRTEDCYIPVEGEDPYRTSVKYNVTANQQYVVYVVVSLKSGLTPAQLDQINGDHVRITMDWGKGSDADKESSTIYYKATAGHDYYCYAYGATGKNHDWPGVKMTVDPEQSDLFSYDLGTQFTTVIFNDGEGGDGHQTADLAVNDTIRSTTPCYDGTNWIAKPAKSTLTKDWYVVGDHNNWTPTDANDAMTFVDDTSVDNDDYYEKTGVQLTAGQGLKVRNASGSEYKSSIDYFGVDAYTNASGDIVVNAAGTYTVRYYLSGANGNYVILEKTA